MSVISTVNKTMTTLLRQLEVTAEYWIPKVFCYKQNGSRHQGRMVAVWKLQQWSLQPNQEKSLIRGVDHDDEHNVNYKSTVTLKHLHHAGYITNLKDKLLFFIWEMRLTQEEVRRSGLRVETLDSNFGQKEESFFYRKFQTWRFSTIKLKHY